MADPVGKGMVMGCGANWIGTARGMPFTDRERDAARLMPLPAAFRCDLATEALTWAPGVYDLFGYPRDARVDRRQALEHYTPQSRALLERARAEAIAGAGSFTLEAELIGADGVVRWMRVTADVVRRGGRAVSLYGVKQDITAEILGR